VLGASTRIPSDVQGSPSLRLSGVWMKKKPDPTAVTVFWEVETDRFS
jgi:hypothetical protein